MRVIGLASVVGIIGVAGVAGAITLRGRTRNVTETSGGNVALPQESRPPSRASRAPDTIAARPAMSQPTTARANVTGQPSSPMPAPVALPSGTAPAAGAGSVLNEGRTTLTDSIYAIRTGDLVVVNFDTKGNRTRRADRFEQIVRTTLPMVFGRRIASVLDTVPQGALLPSRDIIGGLPAAGLHLRLDNGTRIGLWPQTRTTSDGPIVVAYRVSVER